MFERYIQVALTAVLMTLANPSLVAAAESRPLVIHVKTALSVDDAQICAVPNLAWAAVSASRPVTLVFDASAVTSIAKAYGWRGWLGGDTTAMDRAGLPERERASLAEQMAVPLEQVPKNYGEYLRFLKTRGVKVVYNRTMALLYNIPPEQMDPVAEPVALKQLLDILTAESDYLVY